MESFSRDGDDGVVRTTAAVMALYLKASTVMLEVLTTTESVFLTYMMGPGSMKDSSGRRA
jgi:hypothetical protein